MSKNRFRRGISIKKKVQPRKEAAIRERPNNTLRDWETRASLRGQSQSDAEGKKGKLVFRDRNALRRSELKKLKGFDIHVIP